MKKIFLILCLFNLLFANEILLDETKNVVYKDVKVLDSSLPLEKIIDSKEFKTIYNFHHYIRQAYKKDRWIHFKVKNITNKELDKTFLFHWRNANLDFYLLKEKKIIYKKKLVDKNQNSILYVNTQINPRDTLDVYIYYNSKNKNDEFNYLNIVNTEETFSVITEFERFYNSGFFLGILVVMTIQSFFHYLSIKEESALYYGLFQFTVILIISDFRFFVYDLLEEYPILTFIILKAILPSLMFILSAFFSKSFLNTKKNFPFIDKFINLYIIVFISFALYKSFTLDYIIIIGYISLFSIIFLYIGIVSFKRGDGSAFFYTIGTAFFVIFLIGFPFHLLFNFSYEFTKHIQIFIALEALFLSIAVQHKIRNLYLEKERVAREQLEDKKMFFLQSKLAAMGEMIGNIAHQWRQPLNSISMILANIQMQHEYKRLSKEVLEKKINDANSQLKYMSSTIEDFRNFFSHNKKDESINLKSMCEEAISLTNSTIQSNHINLTTSYIEVSKVIGSRSELIQVMIILINNASDAFLINKIKNPELKISILENIIQVEDNAGGISEDIMDRIFDPYFTTKDKSSATGLGLYMSKMIIENTFKSKLKVERIKSGTIFYLDLNTTKNQ